jgi:hypothetical protein
LKNWLNLRTSVKNYTMKKLIALLPALFFSFLLMAQPPQVSADKGASFGTKVAGEETAISAEVLVNNLTAEGQSKEVVIKGKIKEVCKAEGCWVRMETKDGSFLIKMKDHAFLVPVAMEGRTVLVGGTATFKETSVAQLRHFAEDAGKSAEEIAKITEPKKEIVMQATGIKVIE